MDQDSLSASALALGLAGEIETAHGKGDWWSVLGLKAFSTDETDIQKNYDIRHTYLKLEVERLSAADSSDTSWSYQELEFAVVDLKAAKSKLDTLFEQVKKLEPPNGRSQQQGTSSGTQPSASEDDKRIHTAVRLLKNAVDVLEGRITVTAAADCRIDEA
ncbi:unnamed protein product [Tilletia controversa]|uniref:Uncharacterized protein n=3 Tax=Tilletia TaxID=13289 RepID=A0A8X7MVZ2_9BASI|nr:hypothetical protein CF336_g4264 [Tilletia laevis]KAE8198644.1 hypothetical protein CF328_g3490 [Tilletia controversa]KAE8260989.1 hypothetical protein A4X03_0g3637 [Tilletia caries]KAE8201882.1 hypothetical protein CF335_g3633 [Tilletia laevis]KAE8251254.1 hypothetical protein A4X06_0g2756 [Tilletia controversa]